MKTLKTLLLPIILCSTLFLGSCKKEVDEPDEPTIYTLTFWSDFQGAPISVYVNGDYEGQITKVYSTSPGCSATGCVSVTFLSKGSYSFTATDGTHDWQGSGTISATCHTMNLHI